MTGTSHPLDGPSGMDGADPGLTGGATRSRWAPAPEQLPGSLDELTGPTKGAVELPLHVAWSGLRVFELADEKLLLGMYRLVLTTGFHDDYVAYLDGGALVAHWPRLRKMIGRGVRTAWEDAFPELYRAEAA